MKSEEQQQILERRLIAAVADEYRFGALSDADYGHSLDKLGDMSHAEGRAEELRGLAREFGLEIPDDDAVSGMARAALRAEYEGAASAHEELLRAQRSGGGTERGPVADTRLHEAGERVRESAPVLEYLDDIEEDRRWREAFARELSSEAAKVLRAAGYREEKVQRFVRAGLSVAGGAEVAEAADRHGLNPGDLYTYLEEGDREPKRA